MDDLNMQKIDLRDYKDIIQSATDIREDRVRSTSKERGIDGYDTLTVDELITRLGLLPSYGGVDHCEA